MQYNLNSFQRMLEEIPQSKPEAHFVVNDIAKKIIAGEDISEEEKELIKNIFMELQELDRDFIFLFNGYMEEGVISVDEYTVLASYFLIAKQIGPESEKLRDSIYRVEISPEQVQEMTVEISIPENSRQVILSVYKKIFEYKNKSHIESPN